MPLVSPVPLQTLAYEPTLYLGSQIRILSKEDAGSAGFRHIVGVCNIQTKKNQKYRS